MDTNAWGAHPITYHASTICPYAFLAAQRLTNVLWVLVSISHCVPVHDEPANGGAVSIPHINETSSETCFDLLISPVFNVREKAISSFASLRRNSSWLIGASLPVKYATANLAFTSISAITKVKTRSFQSFVVIDSSNEIGECLRLLWLSTWWRFLK